MINAVRVILLIIALSLVSLAGFYFYQVRGNKVDIGNLKVNFMIKGIILILLPKWR